MPLSRDGIAGLICLAVSVGMLALTWGLPPAVMVPVGPAFYPRVIASVLALLSVLLIWMDVAAAPARAAVAAATASPPANYRLVLATFIEFGLYIVLLPLIGFRLSTFLFVLALQVTLEWPASNVRWALVVLISVAASLACFLIFENYLSVLLPRGAWTGA
ncbi:MAG TPA: tripartite tricarboxylate transporter TctB family protein [Xanthobacteraceae bacterium]|nr:tripartite tricarboxylate transporter TctB family protein [Xanthobacteraceae bacterium]